MFSERVLDGGLGKAVIFSFSSGHDGFPGLRPVLSSLFNLIHERLKREFSRWMSVRNWM
jgi:hypothetical protein